jgi:5-methylcytosine-specific restriction endonuclease McrA
MSLFHPPLITPPWKQIRREVLERDRYSCQNEHCESKSKLHVHHIVPRSQGGTNKLDNLITYCTKCHPQNEFREKMQEPITLMIYGITRDRLRNIGHKSETYNSIVKMLISVYEKSQKQ